MTPGQGLVGRLWLAAAILSAEYLAVGLRYDAGPVLSRGGAWFVLARVGLLFPLGAAIASAMVLVGSERGIAIYPRKSLGAALAHLLSLGAFLLSTGGLLSAGKALSAWWIVPWLALVALLAFSLVAALFRVEGSRRQRWRLLTAAFGLGVVAWFTALVSAQLWQVLATPTLLYAGLLLHWVSRDIAIDPSQAMLAMEGFAVEVAPACGGAEGMGLAVVLLGGFLFVKRRQLRIWRALWILPLAAVAAWLANGLRIALLVLIGARVSRRLALGAFHSKAGWLLFCLVTLGTAWWVQRSPLFRRSSPNQDQAWENPAAPLLVPFLAVLGAALVAGALTVEWNWLYGLRVVAGAAALFLFRQSYSRPRWSAKDHAVALALGIVVAVPWIIFGHGTAPFEERVRPFFVGQPSWALPVWVMIRIAGSVVIAPIVEELAFRGYVMRRLMARDFDGLPFSRWTPLAVTGSALLFGLCHQRWLLASVAGLVYAFAVIRRGKLSDGIVAHASSNAVVAAYVLATGDWSLWL